MSSRGPAFGPVPFLFVFSALLSRLASVSHHAARLDVEAHVSDRQTRLIQEPVEELQNPVRIREVTREPERHANRTRALSATMLDDPKKARKIDVGRFLEARQHVVFRQFFRRLTRTRVTETPGAKRDALR